MALHAPEGEVHAAHAAAPRVAGRAAAVRTARRLNAVTLGWNGVEVAIGLVAGIAAGSVSLIGFALDAVVEVSAGGVLAWRLAQERRGGCMQGDDRRAQRLVALSFAALALYVGVAAGRQLLLAERPEASAVGIALAAASLAVMPLLGRAKARVAVTLGSAAAAAESRQTLLCSYLSAVVLAGLTLNAVWGWWWADPAAALGIAVLAAVEARRTWRADSLADTCCA